MGLLGLHLVCNQIQNGFNSCCSYVTAIELQKNICLWLTWVGILPIILVSDAEEGGSN